MRPDSSQQTARDRPAPKSTLAELVAEMIVHPHGDKPPLRVWYFLTGKSRRSSVFDKVRKFCCHHGYGLVVFEVDILNDGSEQDLLNDDQQARLEARICDGEVGVEVLTPP